MAKTTEMLLIEARDPQGRDIATILREAFAEEGTYERVGARLGVKGSTVYRWLPRLGLSRQQRVVRSRRQVATNGAAR